MICKGSIGRVLSISAIVCLAAAMALGDTIRLKDGSTVKGKITSFSGGKFTVSVGEGSRTREFTFDANEIESIEFDRDQISRPVEEKVVSSTSTNKVVDEPQVEEAKTVPAKIETSKPAPSDAAPYENATKPIVITVNVLADNTSNGWTNSGWVAKKGQRFRISGEGEISLGGGRKSRSAGSFELDDPGKLLKSVPTGALLAVIGDDNNDFIYIGASREFVASRDGTLFLGINEGDLKDNSGSFTVKIEIFPGS